MTIEMTNNTGSSLYMSNQKIITKKKPWKHAGTMPIMMLPTVNGCL